MRAALLASFTRGQLAAPVAIFCLALIPRLLWVVSSNVDTLYSHIYRTSSLDYAAPLGEDDMTFYLQTARSIAHGRGYSEPFRGGPTARYPPGWPAVLSPFDRVFGDNALPAATFNAIVGAATCVTTFLLGTRLFSRAIGIAGAIILAIFPSHVLFSPVLLTEIPFTFLFTCVLLAALGGESRRRTLATGLLVGAAAFVRGEALFLPLGLLFVYRSIGLPWRAALQRTVLVAASALAVVAPWTVRNAIQMDAPVLLTTETGVNLMLGQVPQAGNGPDFPAFFAVAEPYRLLQEPRRQVEIERASYRKVRERLSSNPLDEVALVPAKTQHLFQHDPVGGSIQIIMVALWPGTFAFSHVRDIAESYYYLVLAGCVLLVCFQPRSRGVAAILSMAGLWTFVFGIVFFGIDRYHMPLLPLFAVGAAAGWSSLLGFAWPKAGRPPP